MSGTVTGPMATALEAGRERYNAQVAVARRASRTVDPAVLATHLAERVRPLVDAAEAAVPGSAGGVTDALFDASLELAARGLLAPVHPAVALGWGELLEDLAPSLARDPRAVVAAVTNGLWSLERAGARPSQWAERLRAVAGTTDDPALLLDGGRVAGWRAGLVGSRTAALERAGRLPAEVVAAALGVPELEPTALGRLAGDRWHDPADGGGERLAVVGRVGGFRGFGGAFLVPPVVEAAGDGIGVTDGRGSWRIDADRFGAALRRLAGAEATRVSPGFDLAPDGTVVARHRGVPAHRFEALAGATSWVANDDVLAVTLPLSHAVTLVAVAS